MTGGVPQFTRMGLYEYCTMINPFLKGTYKRSGFSESMLGDLDKQQLGLSVSFASIADLSIMVATVTDRQKVGHAPRI